MDRTVIGYKPYSYQRDVHNLLGIRSKETKGRVVVVKSRRQAGKSTMILNELLRYCVVFPKSHNAVLSPTIRQARKIFKEFIDAGVETGLLKSYNATYLIINFVNGSTISFFSGEQGDALRGYTVSGILCIDEAAYVSDEVFFKVLPWILYFKAPILITSTPRFKKGFFYDYYMRGLAGDRRIISIDWTDPKYKDELEKVLPPETLEEYRKIMPTSLFRSEYLGEFVDDGSGVFGTVDWNKPFTADYNSLYFGIDWGTGEGLDRTALVGLDEKGRERILEHWNDVKDPIDQVKKIARILVQNKSKIRAVLAEKNSIGDTYLKLLNRELKPHKIEVRPFTTTNESKREIIENLTAAIGEGNVHLLDEPENRREFDAYQIEVTKGGTITYNGAFGFNDDLVIATAIANRAKTTRYGSYNLSYSK